MTSTLSKYDGLLASFYDADHSWRNYEKQAALVASLYPNTRNRKNLKILDLCCGSGSHALILARHGFRVTGVDLSSALIDQAIMKMKKSHLSVDFKKCDILSLGEDRGHLCRYDCAILLGWTLTIASVYRGFENILKTVFKVLKPGGFFLFDVTTGANINPVPSTPINYKTSSGLKGKLHIRTKSQREKQTITCFYDWSIREPGNSTDSRIKIQEDLRIHDPEEIISRINGFEGQFEITAKLRDYDLTRTFSNGDKNLVIVLKKNV